MINQSPKELEPTLTLLPNLFSLLNLINVTTFHLRHLTSILFFDSLIRPAVTRNLARFGEKSKEINEIDRMRITQKEYGERWIVLYNRVLLAGYLHFKLLCR